MLTLLSNARDEHNVAALRYFERLLMLLRRASEVGIPTACAESEAGFDADPDEVDDAILALLNSDSWQAKLIILEHQQELLLSNTALQLLSERAVAAQLAQSKDVVTYLSLHRAILWRSRLLGITMAWGEYDGFRQANEWMMRSRVTDWPLAQALETWVNTPDFREQRRFLEAHPELLANETDTMLMGVAFQKAGQGEQEDRLRNALLLLRDIRARGEPVASAIRDGYVNAYGGLILLNGPNWLEDMVRMLTDSESHSEEVTKRIALLGEAVERARHDAAVAPETLAFMQRQLAGYIVEGPVPSRDVAFGRALAALQSALTIYTVDRYPRQYAEAQIGLGSLYRERIDGSKRENMERAISAYQEALRVYTPSDFPADYAMGRGELGLAYSERVEGSMRDNLELSIAGYREALRVCTPIDLPSYFASAQNNLGNAYRVRIEGSKRENLEQALAAYHEALRVSTLADFPTDYALVQSNVGLTYGDRIEGSKRENLERAIAAFQEALRVYTLTDFPAEYAMTQNNLGLTYAQRMDGNKSENVERALAAYHEALRVYTLADFPADYAMVHMNLGATYRMRIEGSKRENLEQALAAYHEALRVYTLVDYPADYAAAQNNLGNVYHDRIEGSKRENFERAIAAFQETLRVHTLADFPTDYAMAQNNLGNAYQDRVEGNKRENLERAIAAYQEALKVYTLVDYPQLHRDIQLNLAWLALSPLLAKARESSDQKALVRALSLADGAYTAARQAQAELGWLESDERGRAILQGQREAIREMYTRHAWCLVQMGDLRRAIVALEAGRAQALVEAQVIAGAGLEGLNAEEREAFDKARTRMARARLAGPPEEVRAARDVFLAVRQSIRSADTGHLRHPNFLPDEPEWRDVAEEVKTDRALVYVAATDFGGFALILPPGHRADPEQGSPTLLELPLLSAKLVDSWFVRRDSDTNMVGGWRVALDQIAWALLDHWINEPVTDEHGEAAATDLRGQALQDVAAYLPPTTQTLRTSLERVIDAWRKRADELSAGNDMQRAAATRLQNRLVLPIGVVLDAPHLRRALQGALDWRYTQAELELLLPEFTRVLMQPLRDMLDVLGLSSPDQPVALIASGRLGALPLHAAAVHAGGKREGHPMVPFQETCELSYQASARTLRAARESAEALPSNGPFLTVGDPPTSYVPLPRARREADQIAYLARKAGRVASQAVLGEAATLATVTNLLRHVQAEYAGAWVDIASHGHADPTDPTQCFMLLAHDDRLTLALLQRERILAGVRCFGASGCVTSVGDLVTAPDELGSFAAGVLQAGAASAIATQWSVSDEATYLLMLRVASEALQHPNQTPARALREAAKWLRSATKDELKALQVAVEVGLQSDAHGGEAVTGDGHRQVTATTTARAGVAGVQRDALRGISTHAAGTGLQTDAGVTPNQTTEEVTDESPVTSTVHSGNLRPFEHAYYWAAAVVYGA